MQFYKIIISLKFVFIFLSEFKPLMNNIKSCECNLFTFFGSKVCHVKIPVLDYWRFPRFHSPYFANAKLVLILSVSQARRFLALSQTILNRLLGRVLGQPCQNPLSHSSLCIGETSSVLSQSQRQFDTSQIAR